MRSEVKICIAVIQTSKDCSGETSLTIPLQKMEGKVLMGHIDGATGL